jgi:ATP-binding cassette subfamily C (CFTR/MRP) protein 4
MLFLRYRFAPCSRDLKRLVGTTRSPIYSQLTSTIHGLKVIRSYHAEHICSNEFHHHLDNNMRVNNLVLTLNRWSSLRFDMISLIFIAFAIILAIVARVTQHQFSAVEIALTLTQSVTLMGLLQWTTRQSVEVEAQMTSVERVLEYCSLDQEPPGQLPPPYRPPSNWPSQGHIVFDNVSMSHSKDSHSSLALHHISLSIKPAEKIGIVGRTGAGKSSFIQTLFRMGTLTDGHIIIDNIDIATIGLDDVRRRISIIPQDPALFTGTMRSNLDQFDHYSDAEIWNALEQVCHYLYR